MYKIAKIQLAQIDRLEIKVTNCKKTLAQVKKETGADYILNGGMWNQDGSPCPLLKVGGKNLSSMPWSAYGYSWNTGPDIHMTAQHNEKNFIAVTPLLKDRTPIEKLSYAYAQGGTRGRSAMGLFDGSLLLYCSSDGSSDAATPERLRDRLHGYGWTSAIMLDSGGSSMCDFLGDVMPGDGRKCHNWICVYLKKAETPDKEDKMKKICIDPGHGPGCPNGSPDLTYKEDEFAMDLGDRLKKLLEAQGLSVVMTRDGKGYPTTSARCAISNNAKADGFISLHTNASGDGWSDARGFELITSSGPDNAPRNLLGRAVMDRIKDAGVKLRSTPMYHKGYDVLVGTNAPAVLIEYGFHTNQQDVALLKTSTYRDKLAEATARGVCDWLGITYQDKEEKPVENTNTPDEWAVAAWKRANGTIGVDGKPVMDGTRPRDPITRQELAVILDRLGLLDE